MEGFLISFDGLEGGGKTLQSKRLADWLNANGYPALYSKEPGTAFGGKLREILLSGEACPAAELALYIADRAQHVHEVIRPALAAGQIVVVDRYTDSTMAYQHALRGWPSGFVNQLNFELACAPRPDLTLVLEVPLEQCIARLIQRGGAARLGQQGGLEAMQTLDAAYKHLVAQKWHRVEAVDGSGTPEAIEETIREIVLNRLVTHRSLGRVPNG